MRWLVVLGALAGCDAIWDIDALDEPPSRYDRAITITPASGARLVDFPVSIVITTPDEDLIAHATPSGSDISFFDANGTQLASELVAYSAGTLEAWVRVTLEGTTTIRMSYGDPRSVNNPLDTWSDLYEGAWHLAGDDPAVAPDSTRHAHALAPPSPTKVPTTIAGQVGLARNFVDFDDALRNHQLCADATDRIRVASEPFSYSFWMNAAGTQLSPYDRPFDAGGFTDSPSSPGFCVELHPTGWSAQLADNGTGYQTFNLANPPRNRWAHVTVVVDRPQLKIYVDTQMMIPTPSILVTLGDITSLPFCVGGSLNAGFTGSVDEPRIYRGALTPEWIEAEFDNAIDRDHFVLIDPPSDAP